MFGFFKKKEECPVQDAEKKWIEDGLLWFRSRLGDDYFFQNKILLQSKLFNKHYHAKEQDAVEWTNTGTLFSYDEQDNLLFIQHYEDGKAVKLETFNEDV